MREIKFLFDKIKQYDPWMFVMIVAFAILSGIQPFIWILSPTYILGKLDEGINPGIIIFFVSISALAIISSFIISYIQGNYRMRMNNVRYNLIREVIEYSLNIDYKDIQNKEVLDDINDAMRSVQAPMRGAGGMILAFLSFFSIIVSMFGFLGIFTTLSIEILAVIIALSLIGGYFYYKVASIHRGLWRSLRSHYRQNDRLSYEFRNPMSKQDIIMYDLFSIGNRYFKNVTDDIISQRAAGNKKINRLYLISRIFYVGRDIIVLYRVINQFRLGNLALSSFYMYFSTIFIFSDFIDRFIKSFSDFSIDRNQFKAFIELDDNSEEIKKSDINFKNYDIEFKNVSFKYPGSENFVLKDINFKVKEGEAIALVGENGAGKSTLALLLCGLYEPTLGDIYIGGINVKDIKKSTLRDLISAIFQDSMIFPFTIKENVALNRDYENLDSSYQKSGLIEIINSYALGDSQMMQRILDNNGVELSGGQKQRLFLARALHKDSAKIYILDEPTAQLDALAESELYGVYNKYITEKTSFFISHRLASTKFCDRIIYLSGGEIREIGSHEALMEKRGMYYDLYHIQAKNYMEELDEKHL